MFKFRFYPFYNVDGDIGASSEAPESASEPSSVVTEAPVASGEGIAPTPAAEPEQDVSKQESFAKRLAEERTKLEQEYADKYKDYDIHKELSSYLLEKTGHEDTLSAKEAIEMERLQERAVENSITPELQKRLEHLEERDRQASELERQREQEQQQRTEQDNLNQFYRQFKIDLAEFVKGKDGADPEAIEKFMVDNHLGSMEIAYKAMKHDELASKVGAAKKDGVKEFLQAKGSIPTVPGTNAQGQVLTPAAKTFAEARQRAMARDFSKI